MCGIFGIAYDGKSAMDAAELRRAIDLLFHHSTRRGKEAAGLAIRSADRLSLHRRPLSADRMTATPAYNAFFNDAVAPACDHQTRLAQPIALMGHARLVTNGLHGINDNNQPVTAEGCTVVHNGIVVNDAALWTAHPDLTRRRMVDTEIIAALIGARIALGESLGAAMADCFQELDGAATMGALFDRHFAMAIATNTGSLYWVARDGLVAFASERRTLEALATRRGPWHRRLGGADILRLTPGWAGVVDVPNATMLPFPLTAPQSSPQTPAPNPVRLINQESESEARRSTLRRCTRCILPETIPGITFDSEGVCSVCHNHQPFTPKGWDALRREADRIRSQDGSPDCVIGLSGGRDSSYGLHILVRELGLHPVAYTYDWGLVTDLARRNQSRLTAKLGIEHIIVSADIATKRRHVRRNVEAWLERPDIGLVPLFMAGDKLYFHYAEQVRRQVGATVAVVCGNRFEKTDFKTGFCGVFNRNYGENWRPYDVPLFQKIRLALYYLRGFAVNPRYLNRSLPDTLLAFGASYITPHIFLRLFDYIPWDERQIERTLIGDYGWETAPDSNSTWRIGDGTAAFYNYIYWSVAGFTEHDTLRSNQVREGGLSRAEALTLVEAENQPRYECIRDYATTIGFDFNQALAVINEIPKLY